MANVAAHEAVLTERALENLARIDDVRIIGKGPGEGRAGAVAFSVEGRHPHDIGQVLDTLGVEVRVGHHCAWPLHRRYGVHGTTRASFSVYNTLDEVDRLASALEEAISFFKGFDR